MATLVESWWTGLEAGDVTESVPGSSLFDSISDLGGISDHRYLNVIEFR